MPQLRRATEPGDLPAPRTEPLQRRRAAAQGIHNAVLEALRDAGDIALCEALDLLTSTTGQNRFRHAASVLRGTKLGRHAINDEAALQRIAALPAARRREAVGIEAARIARAEAGGGMRVDSIARRLRRKLRENQTDKMVLSAASIP